MKKKKVLLVLASSVVLFLIAISVYFQQIFSDLPTIITVADYKPLVVSKVYARNGEEIGEFFREKRMVVEYSRIPQKLVQSFLAAEDSSFFEHGGINFSAIFRAMVANIRAGRKVQGGSTITQQVAKSLLLTPEKTYTRKIKEVILAFRMEANLSKEEILYLYLNQIYLGQGAYGVQAAAESYFRKDVKDLTVAESAILAGLPQAPSRYSPTRNPERAKARQVYVLKRMLDESYITQEEHDKYVNENVKVYEQVDFKEVAPYYLETIRQFLVEELGEQKVLDEGIKIYTSLGIKEQLAANEALKEGLHNLDKRQGYRGAERNIQDPKEADEELQKIRKLAIHGVKDYLVILPDGTTEEDKSFEIIKKELDETGIITRLPFYYKLGDITDGIVSKIDDKWGLVYVRFAETQGLISMESMKWARQPNPELRSWEAEISKPSEALKVGDLIKVKISNDEFSSTDIGRRLSDLKLKQKDKYERPVELPEFKEYLQLELEQEPISEAGLISFDMETQEIIAMVGGYDFKKSQFNRTIQAARQTGSAFKSIVFGAALDKGYTPASVIIDSPIVYEEKVMNDEGEETDEVVKWKPHNYSEKFSGDTLFRQALIKSMNIPTVKILQDIGVSWAAEYSRRLGIFSPLNMDLSLGLGSSSVTLYEMTKAFATFGRNGKRLRPSLLHKVTDAQDTVLIEEKSLDDRFKNEIAQLDQEFDEKSKKYFDDKKAKEEEKLQLEADGAIPVENLEQTGEDLLKVRKALKKPDFYFNDPDQLIDPRTAYLTSSLLSAVVEEGTGRRAKELGRPTAAKTGTTNGFYDAWFIGYTANIATGVWVGFDNEKSLGKSETGALSSLPIWLDFMKAAHEDLPPKAFPVPKGIVFANIDADTGQLASARSGKVVRQAFVEGTEPKNSANTINVEDEKELLKEDLVN